jgi:hypothetical protein
LLGDFSIRDLGLTAIANHQGSKYRIQVGYFPTCRFDQLNRINIYPKPTQGIYTLLTETSKAAD